MDAHFIATSVLGALLAAVGWFVARALQQNDATMKETTALVTEVKVLVEKLNTQKEQLTRHELKDEREHDRFANEIKRIDQEMDILGKRDHDLANTVHQIFGMAQLNGWDMPPEVPIQRRNKKNA